MQNFLHHFGTLLLAPFIAVASLFMQAPTPPPAPAPAPVEQRLGATNAIETPVAVFHTSLANQISSTATTMTLVSGLTADGTTLASSTYSFVIDSGQPDQEFVEADCTNTACTNMQRGLSVVTGTSSIASAAQNHRRTATVDIVDAPLLLKITSILNGISTLPNILSYTSTPTFTKPTQIPDKLYIDTIAVAGAPNASESTNGIGQLATAAQASAGVTTGSTGARLLLPASLATSSCTTAQNQLLVASSTTGKLSGNCLDTTSNAYTWTKNQTFSATTTISGASTTTNPLVLNGQAYAFPSTGISSSTHWSFDRFGDAVYVPDATPQFATGSDSENANAGTTTYVTSFKPTIIRIWSNYVASCTSVPIPLANYGTWIASTTNEVGMQQVAGGSSTCVYTSQNSSSNIIAGEQSSTAGFFTVKVGGVFPNGFSLVFSNPAGSNPGIWFVWEAEQ